MYTRREFAGMAFAGLALPRQAANRPTLEIGGVRIGAQSYSFRALPRRPGADLVDELIGAFTACSLGECELWSPQIEPAAPSIARGDTPELQQARQQARADLRKWRIGTPLDHFRGIRKKFAAANITVRAFNYSFNDSFSDEEIDRGFEIARALGAEWITASSTLSSARRVAPFSDKHKMIVGMHNHSNVTDPNEFATPESFAAAMKMSKYFRVNLDIGHFTGANQDAVAYLRDHHADITNLHLKDIKRNQGGNVPWGEGDTPIRDVLQLLKQNKWPIPAYIEYEYRGDGTPIEEVKKGFAYIRQALA
ncbi:MAG: sugar phosphate isomerase/epimerase [Vicinamibacterales bacterium]|nr:sugar phosphate isomerase/epimerase [Vicinamibacterales bacterium]